MNWKQKLSSLEQAASVLEPDSGMRRSMAGNALDHAEQFLSGLEAGKTFSRDNGRSASLDVVPPEKGVEIERLLVRLGESVDGSQINPASGGHLGYIPGGGLFPSALGDFLADVSNRYSGVAFASPGAVRMEQGLVRWMCDLLDFPAQAGGDLTSGGSTANLSAIVCARDAQGINSTEVLRSCIYMTRHVHHCVDKALRVAGLQECPVRFVPMDDRYRMDASMLEEMVRSDLEQNLRPWLVVASAGTTDTGAVDPLLRIAAVCREQDLWLHIDAAYGGFFILCEEGREALAGLGQADSIVMDPHKGLFLPYGTGAVLVRNERLLAEAHNYHAEYMQDAVSHDAGYSPADLSVELSRPFRGLRLWLPLHLFGLAAFRAALAEKIWLARYFHEKVSEIPGMKAGVYPDLSVVTFRYKPEQADSEALNREILQRVLDDGRVFLSSTRIDGLFTLRIAVLHFRTHRRQVDYLLNLLSDITADLG